MRQIIRSNTFETNSSSVHTLIICSKQTWEDFKDEKVCIAGHILGEYNKLEEKDFIPYSNDLYKDDIVTYRDYLYIVDRCTQLDVEETLNAVDDIMQVKLSVYELDTIGKKI